MLFYNNMNYLQLSILLSVLILMLVYVNWKLSILEMPSDINNLFFPRNIFKRYENSLKENFVVDTEQLKNEIQSLNQTKQNNSSVKLTNNVKNMIMDAVNQTVEEQSKPENIISSKFLQEEDTVEDMMKKLNDMEMMCSKIDQEQKMKDDLEQININKSALEELENQDRRIEELAEIVKQMRIEKEKRDVISNKCRVNKQKTVNENYAKVQEMAKLGFLKDESHTVNLSVPKEGIKIDFSDITNKIEEIKNAKLANVPVITGAPVRTYRGCKKPQQHGFDLNKLNNGVCYKCNANVLKKNKDLLRKNFA
jgi:hypothetical protein